MHRHVNRDSREPPDAFYTLTCFSSCTFITKGPKGPRGIKGAPGDRGQMGERVSVGDRCVCVCVCVCVVHYVLLLEV